jgi:hypothetical protein
MHKALVAILLLSVVLVAGCVGQTPGAGTVSDLAMTAVADPPQIRPNEQTQLFIDIENKGQQDIKNVAVDVFDTGPLVVTAPRPGSCIASIAEMRPAQVGSVECKLAVAQPERLIQPITSANVAFRATFQKNISGTFIVDMLSLDELRRLERIGTLEPKQQSMTFGDSQLQATLQFSKAPPFVVGDVVIAQLSVSNVGPGFIGTLDPRRFSIIQSDQSRKTFDCAFSSVLYSYNGVFPPITCIFTAPPVQTAGTYPITLAINYDYELRQSVSITILKP